MTRFGQWDGPPVRIDRATISARAFGFFFQLRSPRARDFADERSGKLKPVIRLGGWRLFVVRRQYERKTNVSE